MTTESAPPEPTILIARRVTVPLPDDLRRALSEACQRDTRPPVYEIEVLLRRALVADGLLPDDRPAELRS